MKYKSATPIPLGYVPLPTQKKLTVHSFLPAYQEHGDDEEKRQQANEAENEFDHVFLFRVS